jgi:hypothetical protein
MQDIKFVLACGVLVVGILFTGLSMYLLWPIMPLVAVGMVGTGGLCVGAIAAKFVSRQVSEMLSHWLDIADKRLALDERKQSMYIRSVESQLVTFEGSHVAALRGPGGLDIQYVPLPRVQRVIESSERETLALASGGVLTASELLSGNASDEICLGTDENGQPSRKEWRKLKAVLILGLQDGGKTNTAIWLISQVLLQGGRLAVIDKHARSEDDSMYQKIKPYEGVFDVPIGDVPASAMRVIKHARKVLEVRLSGAKCSYPLLLVVDEFSAIMRQLGTDGSWSEVATQLSQLIEDFNFEGRKHKCYAICIGQASNASRSGGSEIRDTFNTRIVHRMREKQATLLSMTDEKQQIAQLNKGEVFIDIEGSDTYMVKVPYVDNALVASVARSVDSSEAVQDAFSRGSTDDENGPIDTVQRVLKLREMGIGKGSIINEVWGVKKGASPRYKQAESEYEAIVKGVSNE